MPGNNNEYTTQPIQTRPSLDAFRPFGLISRARPVTSKSNPLINVILKKRKNKSNTCRSTETSTDELLLCLAGQVDKLVDWLHIHWEISLHTDLKKQIKRCIYSLAPCLCNPNCNANQPICQPALLSKAIVRRLKSQCFYMCWICFFFF